MCPRISVLHQLHLLVSGRRQQNRQRRWIPRIIQIPHHPRIFYDCSVAETSLHQDCDEYIFVSVLNDMSKAWLLGRMDRKEYFDKARYMKKGDIDPSNNFTVKANCYNLQIKELNEICLQ